MPRSLGRAVAIVAVIVTLLTFGASGASATNVLLYDDTFGASGTWGTALSQLTLTPTVATSDADFLSKLGTGPWDLVILQLNQTVPAHDGFSSALTTYIASGRLIFSYGLGTYDSLLQVSQNTVYDAFAQGPGPVFQPASLTFTSLFATGLVFDPAFGASTIPLECPMGGTCFDVGARSFFAAPGTTVAASFEDASDGIVVGNSSRTIVNPFAAGYLGNNEVQLYKNEIGYLIAVPEPATGALLGLGLVVTAALGYRRRK